MGSLTSKPSNHQQGVYEELAPAPTPESSNIQNAMILGDDFLKCYSTHYVEPEYHRPEPKPQEHLSFNNYSKEDIQKEELESINTVLRNQAHHFIQIKQLADKDLSQIDQQYYSALDTLKKDIENTQWRLDIIKDRQYHHTQMADFWSNRIAHFETKFSENPLIQSFATKDKHICSEEREQMKQCFSTKGILECSKDLNHLKECTRQFKSSTHRA